MGLSDQLAAHIADFPAADLPETTARAAARALLDAIGVMLGASGMAEEARPFAALAQGAGAGPCAILGTGARTSAPMAALANGALAHALDYEDAFDRVPGHPNASLVPALIALAQSNGPIAGRDFLAGLALGCDLACRMALALDQAMELGGWYPPPILAGFGATAGATRLIGGDARQVRDALSLALCQITMPGEIKYSRDTLIRAVREGFPAQAAVQSALLARAGVAGFEQPLEGRSGFYALYAGGHVAPERLLDGLGARFWIEELTFKPWPSCRGTHPFIEMAQSLRQQAGGVGIATIAIAVDGVQRMLVEPQARKAAPATVIDAKFSIPFCLALALADGAVTLDSFTAQRLGDPAPLELARKVAAQVTFTGSRQPGSGGAMALVLEDGRRLSAEVADARGCPDRPLGTSELVDKFIDCAQRAARPVADPYGLAMQILALEECPDVGALLQV